MSGNNATAYGVRVQTAAPGADGLVWRVESVEHVPDGENGGNHNVYVNVLDETGRDLRGANGPRVLWGWEGQRADEYVPPLVLDKPTGEWGTNFPLYRGQHAWLSVIGRGVPSDKVENLHTGFVSEGPNTADGHHSYRVTFRLVREIAKQPPVQPPVQPPMPDDERTAIAAGLRRVADTLNAAAIDLRHLANAVECQGEAKG